MSIFSKDWWKKGNWSDNLGGLFGEVLKGGADYAAADDIVKRLTEVGSGLAEGYKDLGAASFEKSQFQPFTITSGTGSTSALTDPTTGEFSGVSNTLGAAGTAQTGGIQNILSGMLGSGYSTDPTGGMSGTIGNQAFGGVSGLLSSVTGDRGAREQSIYDRIRATQTPEEDRQRQLLNDQLLNQGRLGLSTSMFGGSPEQFAQEKARAEAMNQASLAAMGQAGQERSQDLATATGLFGLGSQGSMLPYQLQGMQGQNLAQMMGLQYLPEQMMLDQMGAGTNLASIADMGRRYGTGLFDESTGSGLEAILQAELGKTDFLKSLYSGAVGGGGNSGGGGGWFDTIIDTIFG
jgi:hypothetical protein